MQELEQSDYERCKPFVEWAHYRVGGAATRLPKYKDSMWLRDVAAFLANGPRIAKNAHQLVYVFVFNGGKMKLQSLLWRGLAIAAVGCFAAFCSTASMADPLQIQCVSPTVCSAGSITGIQKTTSSPVDFNLVMADGKYAGTAYLVFLEPVGGSQVTIGSELSGSWSSSAVSAGVFAGFNDNGKGELHTYSSAQGFSPSLGGYDVYVDNLGSFTGPDSFSFSLPAGTIVLGFDVITGKHGAKTTLTTPWSEALTVTGSTVPTPEPSTLLLLGSGLLGLGFSLRRRFVA